MTEPEEALDGLTVVTRNTMRRVMATLLLLVVLTTAAAVASFASAAIAWQNAPAGCQR